MNHRKTVPPLLLYRIPIKNTMRTPELLTALETGQSLGQPNVDTLMEEAKGQGIRYRLSIKLNKNRNQASSRHLEIYRVS